MVAFGRVGLTVSSNVLGFGWLGLAGPKSMHMKLRGDLCPIVIKDVRGRVSHSTW